MKIIDVLDFYYSKYGKLNLHIRMDGGLPGKSHDFTKEEAYDFIAGYENENVVEISFQTHYIFKGDITKPLEIPHLFIQYN